MLFPCNNFNFTMAKSTLTKWMEFSGLIYSRKVFFTLEGGWLVGLIYSLGREVDLHLRGDLIIILALRGERKFDPPSPIIQEWMPTSYPPTCYGFLTAIKLFSDLIIKISLLPSIKKIEVFLVF